MSEPVISIRNLSKSYAIYDSPRDLVKEIVLGGIRHDLFWALRDVSLDIFEGQRIGIIGPNGAGKSTLLKIVAGTLNATSGTVDVRGRVSAMLALNTSLEPDETGLENIRFNLIVNGASRSDIPSLMEDIIDFTELGAFVHAPVRTYSSGMNARLAFGISTAIKPDILIVDEILSAGDAYFSSKATTRMVELTRQGRALLFVSHAMNAVQLLCDTAIWLDGGGIRDIGPVNEVAQRYEAEFRQQEDDVLRDGNRARRAFLLDKVLPQEFERSDLVRLRLVGLDGRLGDTHYVRRLTASVNGTSRDVPLTHADIDRDPTGAALDIVHSEWGRLHDRRGSAARTLAASSRPLRGGQILLKFPPGERSPELEVEVERTSVASLEPLRLQWADAANGEWTDIELVEEHTTDDGWHVDRFRGRPDAPDGESHPAQLERLFEMSRSPIEILAVTLHADGGEVVGVSERQPFSIAVRLNAYQLVPLADVWLKLMRSDGVYVFWQSSGQADGNLVDLEGEATVRFRFEPNPFGAGDYSVQVDVSNGFDIDRNWPATEIYDRKVNALAFTVAREWPLFMAGVVNQRFPVEIER